MALPANNKQVGDIGHADDHNSIVNEISALIAASASLATQIISTITDSAPATLDTLNELAAALGDDSNFSTSTASAIGQRLTIENASATYLSKTDASSNYLLVSSSSNLVSTIKLLDQVYRIGTIGTPTASFNISNIFSGNISEYSSYNLIIKTGLNNSANMTAIVLAAENSNNRIPAGNRLQFISYWGQAANSGTYVPIKATFSAPSDFWTAGFSAGETAEIKILPHYRTSSSYSYNFDFNVSGSILNEYTNSTGIGGFISGSVMTGINVYGVVTSGTASVQIILYGNK